MATHPPVHRHPAFPREPFLTLGVFLLTVGFVAAMVWVGLLLVHFRPG